MAGFPPKSGKPVTEKKKRKRPSKKVPTTVLESSSTNFMDLVQKLTGSAAELASTSKPHDVSGGDKRPKSAAPSPVSPEASYFQNYLQNAIATSYNNDNDSSSSSHSTYTPASSPFSQPANFMAMDPTSGYNSPFAGALGDDDDLLGYTGASSSRAMENDVSLFSSSWRDPSCHSDYWYHQMDAMRV